MVLFFAKNFTVTHFISLHFKTKSLHLYHVSSLHITTLHITSLIYTQSPLEFPLAVTTSLSLFLNVFSLQGKDASKPAGNLFQILMVLFTEKYLPTSVLCFLVLIFQLCSCVLLIEMCFVQTFLYFLWVMFVFLSISLYAGL